MKPRPGFRRIAPIPVALLCGTFLAGAAKAPTKKNAFGKYEGRWGEFTLEERAGGKAHLDFSVGLPGCAGAIEGDGVLEGRTFTLVAPVENQENPCRLKITFGKKATVETEGCTHFHGASCEFDGDYRRASKRRK
jgi:hypothetical protein